MSEEFARGAREAGNDVERIDLRTLKISGCLGCRYCYSHGGECVQKDDMGVVTDAISTAEMVVFASPIYWFDITAQLKTVIDRMYSRGSVGFNFSKTALLLNSGADNVYDAAVAQYKAMTSYLKWQDMGIVTAPDLKEKGAVKDSPAMEEAYRLGLSL